MDQQRSRIQEDLRGLITGEVRCDDVFVQLYASDASIYEVRPLGVIAPRSTADVVACVQYAHENNLPLHARGAGSGLAGESLGPGLIIDFSRHLRRVIYTGEDTVRVQPGIVHERLNDHLRRFGRQFGPDPATSSVTTLGGVISVDSGGSHWLKYGSARRHVVSLQVALADGTVLELGRERVPDSLPSDGGNRRNALVGELAGLLEREQSLIESHRPRSLVNRCGYQLGDVLSDGHLDVAKLLAGSEGTLGLITEATLATQPLPKHRAVALLFFQSLERAARAAVEVVALEPSACDLMDRRHLILARETDPRYVPIIPPGAEAMLLLEEEGDDPAAVLDRLHLMVDRLRRKRRLAYEARLAFDAEEIDLFWKLAIRVVPTLYRLKGSTRPLPFVEDMAAPPAEMPGLIVELQNILKRRQVVASLFAHAGHGQLHLRPFLDLTNPDDVAKIVPLARDLYDATLAAGGTISGEHGVGLSRLEFVQQQYGDLCRVFREVKRIFDPAGVLNPGKIVSDQQASATEHLRPAASPARVNSAARSLVGAEPNGEPAEGAEPVFELQLNWSPEELVHTAQLQRLRRLPFAIGRGADVPDLPFRASRRGLAARQGQLDARRAQRAARRGDRGQR